MASEQVCVPAFNENLQTIQWERLEKKRLEGLRLKVSPRSLNVLRRSVNSREAGEGVGTSVGGKSASSPSKVNSVAPFSSLGKPTCGYFFNYTTDNRKRNFGIPPSDLVKWRNFSAN